MAVVILSCWLLWWSSFLIHQFVLLHRTGICTDTRKRTSSHAYRDRLISIFKSEIKTYKTVFHPEESGDLSVNHDTCIKQNFVCFCLNDIGCMRTESENNVVDFWNFAFGVFMYFNKSWSYMQFANNISRTNSCSNQHRKRCSCITY